MNPEEPGKGTGRTSWLQHKRDWLQYFKEFLKTQKTCCHLNVKNILNNNDNNNKQESDSDSPKFLNNSKEPRKETGGTGASGMNKTTQTTRWFRLVRILRRVL